MPKTSGLSRQKRLDQILGLLRSKAYWTTAELRKAIGVSQRTLMRDLADLAENGTPIETERGRGGGIRLAKNWGIGKIFFSLRESTDLLLALSVMEKMNSPLLLKELRSVKMKLYQLFPQDQRKSIQSITSRILVREPASEKLASTYTGLRQETADSVQKSFFEKRILTINYESENKSRSLRRVEPYYLILIWPIWYIQAWDHKRESIRFFRLDRIISSSIEKETFTLERESEFRALADQFFEQI